MSERLFLPSPEAHERTDRSFLKADVATFSRNVREGPYAVVDVPLAASPLFTNKQTYLREPRWWPSGQKKTLGQIARLMRPAEKCLKITARVLRLRRAFGSTRCLMISDRRIGVIETYRTAADSIVESRAPLSLAVDKATETEASEVTEVISEAFLRDPTWSWAFPDPAARRKWWKFCIREALRYPWTFKTEGYETVSVWIPPNETEFSHDAELS